jgi:hypothetical protein
MMPVDSLLLDAKQAILDEHHRRFQTLHREGRLQEAMQQFHLTMASANDLLSESIRVLEETLEAHEPNGNKHDLPPST